MSLGELKDAFDDYFAEGDDPEDIQEMLLEFHRVMRVPVLPTPQVPSDDRVRLRAKLIAEECMEFLDACFVSASQDEVQVLHKCLVDFIELSAVRVNLPKAADALADIAYVVEGSNLEFGIDSGPVLDEVHEANMAKANGPVREDGKRLKPPGWRGPDIAEVLREQGA